jgi:hypothetical protein
MHVRAVRLAYFGYFIPQLLTRSATGCGIQAVATSNSPTEVNLVRFCPSPEARLSIPDSENVRIEHAGTLGNQSLGERVLLVQRGSQVRQDCVQIFRVFRCHRVGA